VQQVIPAQRRAKILELVQRHGAVSLHELASSLATSASTIRRDLDFLTENHGVERTHGGVRRAGHLLATTFEPDYEIGRHTRVLEKRAIGRAAAGLIPDGASVFFDSSTTVLESAKALASSGREITAITNDLNIALHLAQAGAIRTIVPGGTVRPRSYTLFGDPGNEFLAGMHVDVALLGIHSLARGALSDSSVEIVQSKRATLRAGRRSILLADAGKFSAPRSFLTVASLSAVDDLVTDDSLSEDERRLIVDSGVTLHVASGNG
jgi:DeoR family transcriptional regulator, aga operon transcriptional repressor